MTAAIFVMSSLRNGFLNRHTKMAAHLLQTEEDPIAQPDLAHTNRSAVRCYETNRFRVLDDRGIAAVVGLGFDKEKRSTFDFHATDDHRTGAAFRVHCQDVVARAEFAEILGRASGQIDVRMDWSGVHPEWTAAHLLGLEGKLRFRSIVNLHEQPGPAPLEERDQILERDDRPWSRPNDHVFRRAPQSTDRRLILCRANRREPSDLDVAEEKRRV